MIFLPIVGRELRVASRKGATYWLRLGAALAAVGAAAWILLLAHSGPSKQTGLLLFVTLTVLTNLYALLVGLRTTADSLSEEKREGTLGLLFLTDLRGYDIVLGKLAATSLNASYAMVGMFPVLGLAQLMGGVAPQEFWRVVLASVSNLLFSLAAGLFCSSLSRDDRKAVGATFLIVFLSAVLPVIGSLLAAANGQSSVAPLFQLLSPSYTCWLAFDTNFKPTTLADNFWVSLLVVQSLSWLFLALACLIVPRTWQEKSTGHGQGNWRERWEQWQFGSAEVRLAWRRQLLEANPIHWLTSRERFKTGLVWIGLALAAGFWIWGEIEVGRDWFEVACVPAALTAHTLLKVWMATESSRRFAEDRRSGALELLLATPLSVRDILRGQRQSLARQFAGPTAAVLVVDLYFIMRGLNHFHGDESAWVVVWLAGMGMLGWDMATLSWVGLWMGLNSRSPHRAATAALVRVCLVPWLLFAGLMAAVVVVASATHSSGPSWFGPTAVTLGWFIVGGVNNVLFGLWAKTQLHDEFRETATRRFEAHSPGVLGRLFGDRRRG
ncbi:MAG: ABC transporter permease [Verrucomicrobia bacterium]|nr:ABC transporter permease [Verrucomicrobiota bacterium]